MDRDSIESYLHEGTTETATEILEETRPVRKAQGPKPARILYFTDPLSPSGYAMERQLEILGKKYHGLLNIEYHMGGLMPLWEMYRNNGINTHADMARYWKYVGKLYNLPISGNVWLTDPPYSSFPASIAFKAAQLQDEQKAAHFLQHLGKTLFVENKNISKWKYLEEAAVECDLNIRQLKYDHTRQGRKHFEEDLLLAQKLGVMAFPSLIFENPDNKRQQVVEGYQSLDQLERALSELLI